LTRPGFAFAALSGLYFLVTAGTFNGLGVVLPSMVRELDWNWKTAGAGYALLGVACGLSSLAASGSIRRFGVRPTLIGGGAMLVAGFALLARVHTSAVYLFATALLGVAFSFTTSVVGTHVLTAIFSRRATAVGAYFTLGALGGVAGPQMFQKISELVGWRPFWLILAAAAALAALLAAWLSPNRVEPTPELPPDQAAPKEIASAFGEVRRALATPQFWVLVGAYTTYMLVNTTAHGFAVEHLIERGASAPTAATVLSAEALVGAIVSVIGGVIGERTSARSLMLACLAFLVAGMAALALAHGLLSWTLFALSLGAGFGLSFVAATLLLLAWFGQRAYLELYSIMCLVSTAAAAGPALGGWARDSVGGFSGVFLICGAAAAAFFVLMSLTPPPKPASALLAAGNR
jgi:MFS family permease